MKPSLCSTAPSSVINGEGVMRAAQSAASRIAPIWPLKTFVAVNPFVGLTKHGFFESAELMARAAGARMTMPRSFYLEALAKGELRLPDVAEALAATPQARGNFVDPQQLLRAAQQEQQQPIAMTPTIADLAAQHSGVDWPAFVTERIALFAADHFDQGQATWNMVSYQIGLYAQWREVALIDRAPEVAGLRGFRSAVAALPETAELLLLSASKQLGVPAAALDGYYHRLLMSIGGFAGHARYRQWQQQLHGRNDTALVELLAVRLAWDAVLAQVLTKVADQLPSWQEALTAPLGEAQRRSLLIDVVLQTAFDTAWQRQLATQIQRPAPPPRLRAPKVMAAFCIDVRSERFRRALESVTPQVETIGFGGFFGVPIEYVPIGHRHGGAQCPVLLKPSHVVHETVRDAKHGEPARIAARRLVRRWASKAWHSFRLAAVSSFAYVETLGLVYAAKLLGNSFGVSRAAPHPAVVGLSRSVRRRLKPGIEPSQANGRHSGFALGDRVAMAETILRGMSLTTSFARLVVLVGHGATTVNNPHASGLDCGACGGHSGEANARVAVEILADPQVRAELRTRGIVIPEDTLFLAALHDTTTDEVHVFETDLVPDSHSAELAAFQHALALAGRIARAERMLQFEPCSRVRVDAKIVERSRDWSQVRPEWGLAGCAAFIAAPRERTAGLDLAGKSFLHSYDWRQDQDFATLHTIMTAPMIVASWISLQYYGSTVDNAVFGSGNKVLHNVVGTIGVLEGNGGDLRPGLPWQSLHDGERLVHQPLRLPVVIEAPTAAIEGVIAAHAGVRELVEGGWITLFAIDDHGALARRPARSSVWVSMSPALIDQAA